MWGPRLQNRSFGEHSSHFTMVYDTTATNNEVYKLAYNSGGPHSITIGITLGKTFGLYNHEDNDQSLNWPVVT